MTQPILSIKGLQVAYGGIQAVKKVDMEIMEGELVTLIGSNGAGKTTTLKAITGMIPMKAGEVTYQGKSINGVPSWESLANGIVMVPEGRGVFARMTITENLQMGAYLRKDNESVERDIDRMFDIFPRLKERATQLAGTMSGGEQQMLAMARALMSQPKLLIMDEPTMGLSPVMTEKIFEVIDGVSKEGMTILLIEQNAKLALESSQRGYVMESGEITLTGESAKLLDDPKVRAAYLGG